MFEVKAILHASVDLLLWPVIAILLTLSVVTLYDIGLAIGERFGGIKKTAESGAAKLDQIARTRIRRVDLLVRLGPTLGLMGTLIPLGPGIAALGRGDFLTLSQAVATAFDTTVLGLLIGLCGYVIGRFRRAAYDAALTELEAREGQHA
ncbi:MAG: MotA/TolQ/ExbB proton channel family protein [Pseudomonadota bacterium]